MRKRISGFGSLGVSGDDLLKEIKNERARELYLEGFRLSDLKRWHDPIKRQKQLYSLQGPYNNVQMQSIVSLLGLFQNMR